MDALDRMGYHGHPEEDCLERYVMKTCTKQENGTIENHLLECEQCRARLSDADEWVSLMKIALPLGPARPRVPRRWRLATAQMWSHPAAMAGGAALAVILLAAPLLLREPVSREEFVLLSATRGGADQWAHANTLLRLRLDTTGLVEPFEGQIADDKGGIVWSQPISSSSPELKLDRKLKPGVYWVRINSLEGAHPNLREFSLRVK